MGDVVGPGAGQPRGELEAGNSRVAQGSAALCVPCLKQRQRLVHKLGCFWEGWQHNSMLCFHGL